METGKEECPPDGEDVDIPSDFFDDFAKDSFMDGLSVIDSWDEDERKCRTTRTGDEGFDNVKDLRELIESREDKSVLEKTQNVHFNSEEKNQRSSFKHNDEDLNQFIKPGSRRDPNKTKESIKRDKEMKVKQHLAKHLDDDLRPPGTEMDDFFMGSSRAVQKSVEPAVRNNKYSKNKESPTTKHKSPLRRRGERISPYHNRESPRRYRQQNSPPRIHYTENYNPKYHYKNQQSTSNFSSRNFSREKRNYARRHLQPDYQKSPRRSYHSRSPSMPMKYLKRSYSRSPQKQDSFLYPEEMHYLSRSDHHNAHTTQEIEDFPERRGYPTSTESYNKNYCTSYEYGGPQTGMTQSYVETVTVPQALPMPVMGTVPTMVPPPNIPATPSLRFSPVSPNDALAQLLAEGKISKEDYLKLTPNKGSSCAMDTKTRVKVLTQCNQALSELGSLLLPHHIIMRNNLVGDGPKPLVSKFCSPLKRQIAVEFNFTSAGFASSQQNKQLIDSIVTTLGLSNKIVLQKKKSTKKMIDAAVQTIEPYCEMCKIRESIKCCNQETSTDQKLFTSAVHTQVVEEDLFSSKAVFNPSGSVGSGAPISIAHMTSAQLVSQLAARAKTFKRSNVSPSNYKRNTNNYENESRGPGGSQYYNNYYRY